MAAEFYTLAGVFITAIVAYLGHRIMRPKILAEARKAEAEAASMDWARFQAEIERLELKIAAQDEKIAAMELDRAAVALIAEGKDRENMTLRSKVIRLEKRVSGLESIFKIHPIPAEMQAALDALDREQ